MEGRRGQAGAGRAGARVRAGARAEPACDATAIIPVKRSAPPSSGSSKPSTGRSARRSSRRCSPTCSPRSASAELVERVIVVTGERRAERIALRHARRATDAARGPPRPRRTPATRRRPRWGSSAPRRSEPACVALLPGDCPLLDAGRARRGARAHAAAAGWRSSPTATAPAPTRSCSRRPTRSAPAFGPGSCARHADRARARRARGRGRAARLPGARRRHARRPRGAGRGAGAQRPTAPRRRPPSWRDWAGSAARARGMSGRRRARSRSTACPRSRAGDRARRADRRGGWPARARSLAGGDVVAVAQKAVSKAEGRVRELRRRRARAEARRQLAARLGKDPRLVELILGESRAVVRAERGVLIVETLSGWVCANAGIDASNVPGTDRVTLLPEDPDASARRIRAELGAAAGVRRRWSITDSFGRPWRLGQTDVAIGCAGLTPLDDWRGRTRPRRPRARRDRDRGRRRGGGGGRPGPRQGRGRSRLPGPRARALRQRRGRARRRGAPRPESRRPVPRGRGGQLSRLPSGRAGPPR